MAGGGSGDRAEISARQSGVIATASAPVTGPVADAEFFYPAAAPSAASAAARSNLAAQGYALQPL